MDPNYAMAKFGLESKDILKSKDRGCWYYTKYFFFFLSIIQFLIILGLVLFMLYGNAHFSTEDRLKSVQTRYNDDLIKYNILNTNYSQLKSKVTSLEKENQNCSNQLSTTLKQLQNRTTCGKPIYMVSREPQQIIGGKNPVSELCRPFQFALERCNTTYTIDTLQLKHQILILQRDLDRLKEKCDHTGAFLTSKLNVTASEVEKLQEEKKALETQIKILQNVCTNINEKFQMEVERMKSRFEGIINVQEPFQYSKCWSISNDIKNNIDQSVLRLKQDVNNVMFENSQLKTDNARVNDNFQKCSQEKVVIVSEKNHLSIEKGGLEKQLFEKKEDLAKSYSKYMKKEEELENCRKMQPVGRLPFPRI